LVKSFFSGTVALIGVVSLCGITGSVNAQRLEDFGKGPLIKVQGSVSLDQVAYYASGITGRRDPYNFYLNAAMNLDIYGLAVPFSFSYSNQSRGSFQQPFNQFSLNPSYKWVTASVGNQSASFSSYTLNGHSFSGLGLDLSPQGPWKYHLLAGRFQKATRPGDLDIPIEPTYQRYGYGVKVGYQARNQYELIVFKAHDLAGSLETRTLIGIPNPQDNLVLGFNARQRFGKSLLIRGEVGLSALTNDMRVLDSVGSHIPGLGFLLRSNSSTALHKAIKAGVDYSIGKVILGVGYERVDPEYKTLGAYYFNNDLQNYTANLSTRMWQEKVSLAVNAGVQNNDLKKDKQSSMQRFVGAVNLGLNINSRLNFISSYSNFQSYNNIRSAFRDLNQLTPYENLDTLNFHQISQNANLGVNYILKRDKEKTSVININLAWYTSADQQGGQKQGGSGGFYDFNGNYAVSLVPQTVSMQVGLNASRNVSDEFPSVSYGPTAGLSGTLFEKKLRNNLVFSWNQSTSQPGIPASIFNARLNSGYAYRKKHTLNTALGFMSRKGMVSKINKGKMHEYTATIGYRYTL